MYQESGQRQKHDMTKTGRLNEEVSVLLTTSGFGRELRFYEDTSSTNTVAAAWARESALEGSVVLAEFQHTGRGRHGRPWFAERGVNLTFSIVLRPVLPVEKLCLVVMAASLAVRETVARYVDPVPVHIKWPNDILLNGRKCCGMLLESSTFANAAQAGAVILGIGLNVNQVDFPPEIEDTATSIALEAGRPVPRAAVLAGLLLNLEQYYHRLFTKEAADLPDAYERALLGLNQEITVHTPDERSSYTGILIGIDESAALRLKIDEDVRTFHAGEVTLRSHHAKN
jgi:BirA family transcriptional regulator, biotin operon repressor / biotin---[acetyl-CoA-carboxylase] ligase